LRYPQRNACLTPVGTLFARLLMRASPRSFRPTRRARLIARTQVVFAASGGGHFTLLDALSGVAPQSVRQWVTVEGPRSRALTAQGETVFTIPTFDAQHLNLRNPICGIVAALRLRPRVVISSGAGVVLSFVLTSWLLGARIVFIETMARVTAPSRTGQILALITSLHIVQWPELRRRLPKAVLCRPVLIPKGVDAQLPGEGTFVSVGTHSQPFDRLLRAVDTARARELLPAPCIAQVGPSRVSSSRWSGAGTLSPSEFEGRVAGAQYVVGHCGAGLIAAALRAGRRPIVMARRASLHEHVDDHQLQLAAKLADCDLVVHVTDAFDAQAISRASQPLRLDQTFPGLPEAEDVIRGYLASMPEP
jgi:UDP-N-acetylglucosamine--N-acetylmuramyl-(pentapeptide) pyrophosphoryl-undecaprenol N-acetylglucosamine transferase